MLKRQRLQERANSIRLFCVLIVLLGVGVSTFSLAVGLEQGDIEVAINNVAVDEDEGELIFTLSITGAPRSEPFEITYRTVNETAVAGEDYETVSGSIEILPDVTTAQIPVAILDDVLDEDDETFLLELEAEGDITFSPSSGEAKIDDNDPRPEIAISELSVGGEEAGSLNFQVTLSEVSGRDVTVQYQTKDDTARAGEDYTAVSETLTISAGSQEETIAVTIIDDAEEELDETFGIALTNPENAELEPGNHEGAGKILDDDRPRILISDAQATEVNRLIRFMVELSKPSNQTVEVEYETEDGEALGGHDYIEKSGSLVFEPDNQGPQVIEVALIQDDLEEEAETFFVKLKRPQNANVGSKATGKIISSSYFSYLPTLISLAPTWQRIGDTPDEFDKFRAIAVCGSQFIAGANNGLYQMQEGENEWRQVAGTDGFVVSGVAFASNDCSQAFATVRGLGTWSGRQSNDESWAWGRILNSADLARDVAILDDKLFVGGDFGLQWTRFSVEPDPIWQSVSDISGLVTSINIYVPTNSNDSNPTLLVTVWQEGVYQVSINFGSAIVNLFDGIADKKVYEAAGVKDSLVAGTATGLAHFSDGAWQTERSGATFFAVIASDQVMYAGQRSSGVVRSIDRGKTWREMSIQPEGAGDAAFQIRDFFLYEEYLYAATTSGVWRLKVDRSSS